MAERPPNRLLVHVNGASYWLRLETKPSGLIIACCDTLPGLYITARSADEIARESVELIPFFIAERNKREARDG